MNIIKVEFETEVEAHLEEWWDDAACQLAHDIMEWPQFIGQTFRFHNTVTDATKDFVNSYKDGTYALRPV